VAVLTAYQMVLYWETNGGPSRLALPWISVSRAESSWDTEATSPTDAHGLYQIEPYSWPAGAGDGSRWADPNANSAAAVILSGGGVNFAPWDTAYADIEASGRYSFLAWPENGSAAANRMPEVAGELGTKHYGTLTAPDIPGLTGTLPDAIRWYSEAANAVIPNLAGSAKSYAQRARRLY
jgi:Lysozyme like domain